MRTPRWSSPVLLIILAAIGSLALLVAIPLAVWKLWPEPAVGLTLIYEVDSQGQSGYGPVDMQALVAAMDRRVNPDWSKRGRLRLLEGDRIEVAVFGNDPKEHARIEHILAVAGTLEFRILASNRNDPELTDQARQEEAYVLRDADGNELGRWVPVALGREANFSYYHDIETRIRRQDSHEVLEILVVKDPWDVTGEYLAEATMGWDANGDPCINFRFNRMGGQLFGGLTGENLPDSQDRRRNLGIILDGCLYSAPGIRTTIYDRGEITGNFTTKEVRDLVDVLNAGTLPARIRLVKKTPVDGRQ